MISTFYIERLKASEAQALYGIYCHCIYHVWSLAQCISNLSYRLSSNINKTVSKLNGCKLLQF